MTTFHQAAAAIAKTRALIDKLGGVTQEIVPEVGKKGWYLRARTVTPLRWPVVLKATNIGMVEVIFQSDYDRPLPTQPRTRMTDTEILALPRFSGRR